ncbi:hypothetical protein ACFQJ7_09115 [Halovenus rubra]|uniref:Uncharacterized protein n=2 Tax=Halovenus rubra TaxID=869890 RepID=A0ABD5X8B0_9EURY|nr:hypothetical protein [Halovenus rubra]
MTETVTSQREPTSKGGMGIFGKAMLLGMVIILLPLLPIYLVLKLYRMITGTSEPRA